MNKASNTASIRDVYELVERVRMETKQDIVNAVTAISSNQGRLENLFNELEAGRLTRAESDIKKLQVAAATINVKLAILVFIATAVASTFISIIVSKVMS